MTGKMKQMGMDMVMEGSGDITGTVWFDPALGLLIEEQNNTSMEMTLALTGQTQMTIPMSQKTKSPAKRSSKKSVRPTKSSAIRRNGRNMTN